MLRPVRRTPRAGGPPHARLQRLQTHPPLAPRRRSPHPPLALDRSITAAKLFPRKRGKWIAAACPPKLAERRRTPRDEGGSRNTRHLRQPRPQQPRVLAREFSRHKLFPRKR